ncbi:hypothetical protein FIBSPDRAFT_869631 [Athelia psychrophila]|uniref:Uncharacterized protein n=1 Tax=Athelia psychrophila TaxID=1759441 RepID=A0A166C0L6_9AGAM|nr:hypothetical protein FIBSPDRAFT_869631 [Fibularhizoctonia sp. CBS 109695]
MGWTAVTKNAGGSRRGLHLEIRTSIMTMPDGNNRILFTALETRLFLARMLSLIDRRQCDGSGNTTHFVPSAFVSGHSTDLELHSPCGALNTRFLGHGPYTVRLSSYSPI